MEYGIKTEMDMASANQKGTDETHKNIFEQKKPNCKEKILYDCIYENF